MKRLLLFVLLASFPCWAQEAKLARPEPKRVNVLKSKKFWIETAITFGFAAWDAESTVSALKRCQRAGVPCFEVNGLFGSTPSRKELYWKGGLVIAAERAIIGVVWHYKPNAGSAMSTFVTGGHMFVHSVFVNRNNHLLKQQRPVCPSGTVCQVR